MPFVSIIIVNFNAGLSLVSCVTSIADASDRAEIIVVDNASTDDSIEDLTAKPDKRENLHIIRNPANLGFARACNIGAHQARGEYLLFLNPDCVINSNTIPALVAALEKHPRAGMAGGRLINPDGTEQAGGRRDIPTPWRSVVRLSGLYRLKKVYPGLFPDFLLHEDKVPEAEIEVEAVSGACMMVPRKILNEVGGFDEAYFLHVEDLDWCFRIRQKGWKVLFVPAAQVIHAKGGCSHERPVFVEWHKHRGLTRFYGKYFGRRYFGLWLPVYAAGIWGHFLLVAALKSIKRKR